jgi:hypothetical protein
MSVITGMEFRTRQECDVVSFRRPELSAILTTYGRLLAAGACRDYAISHLKDAAVFAVFRRASESPLFRIEKRPRAADRQGLYSVAGADGRVLRTGTDLAEVLRVFDRLMIRAVAG